MPTSPRVSPRGLIRAAARPDLSGRKRMPKYLSDHEIYDPVTRTDRKVQLLIECSDKGHQVLAHVAGSPARTGLQPDRQVAPARAEPDR
jgi:hypothetical protein